MDCPSVSRDRRRKRLKKKDWKCLLLSVMEARGWLILDPCLTISEVSIVCRMSNSRPTCGYITSRNLFGLQPGK